MYCNIKLPEFLFLVGVSRLDVWDEENLGFFKFLSQKDYPKIRKGKCMMEADGQMVNKQSYIVLFVKGGRGLWFLQGHYIESRESLQRCFNFQWTGLWSVVLERCECLPAFSDCFHFSAISCLLRYWSAWWNSIARPKKDSMYYHSNTEKGVIPLQFIRT